MNEINEKFLPIGTIVKLKKSDALFMIAGYSASLKKDKNKKYDYMSYIYPIGFNSKEDNYVFNYGDIEKIVFNGYKDKSYNNMLNIIGGDKND